MIVGVFSLSGKETPLFDVGWNSGFSCSGTSMGFTVIFLLVGSSTACISSHLFVVVVVEPNVAVIPLVEDVCCIVVEGIDKPLVTGVVVTIVLVDTTGADVADGLRVVPK